MSLLREQLESELEDAELKAWDALSRYKFWMFGYWAACWVKFNRLGGFKRPNPFRAIVDAAKTKRPHLSKQKDSHSC